MYGAQNTLTSKHLLSPLEYFTKPYFYFFFAVLFAACFGLSIHIQFWELLLTLYLYQAFVYYITFYEFLRSGFIVLYMNKARNAPVT